MPEAQFRCTVKAGTERGTPASSAATRAMFADSAGVPQLPSTTSSTRAGSSSVRAMSSRTATRPSSCAGTSASAVPAFAKGVRRPSTMTTLFPAGAPTAMPMSLLPVEAPHPCLPRALGWPDSSKPRAARQAPNAALRAGAARSMLDARGGACRADRAEPAVRAAHGGPLSFTTLVELYRRAFADLPRPDAFRHRVDGAWRDVSSAEAQQAIERVAAALATRDVAKGERVAILSENRLEWALADFGILTAGAVVVPVYPTLT